MSKTTKKASTPVPAPNPAAAWSIGTQCIQAGFTPTVGGPRTLPIFQTTTYKYDDLDQVERLFALKETGYKYTRTGNPTVAGFEAKVTLLEGGVGAVATASGQSAILLAVANLVHAGEHIVAANNVYGGTWVLFAVTLKKLGVETTLVDPESPVSELRKAFRPNTRLVFGETIGNPALGILDFDKFAKLAREFDVPFIVDNTLATPFLCKPFKHGANIVVHSATSTHSQLARKDRLAAGIPDDMIRVSVGIEDAPDLIADFDQALKASSSPR